MGAVRPLEHGARQVALISGLVLFAFAAAELCNEAVGLVSLETMGLIAEWRAVLFRSWPGTAILAVATISHIGTTLYFVARRATLRMSWSDAGQTLSGLLIPLLLLPYLVDTRGANALFGVSDDTLYRLAKLWPAQPYFYTALIVLLWGHGCLGLHQWLRRRPGYVTIAPMLAVAALALPIAAIAGLIASARVVSVLMADDAFAGQIRAATHWPSGDAEATLWRLRLIAVSAYGAVLIAVAGALVVRILRIVVAPKIELVYVNGPTLKASVGPTLLEISHVHDVPHADACGGRGRCTTCSVRIEDGGASLPAKTTSEIAMLGAGNAAIRLACQIRPTAALTVTRLASTTDAVTGEPDLDTAGVERELVALCVELVDHAKLIQRRAAYDAIFLINEFLDAVCAPIAAHQGWVMRLTDAGIIAVFGRDGELPAACRAAVAASAGIDVALDRLNEKFAAELGQPIAAAMGLALGPAYLGRIGAGPSKTPMAIGPAIDAARELARQPEHGATQLLADAAIFQAAGIDTAAFEAVSPAERPGARQLLAIGRARLAVAAQM